GGLLDLFLDAAIGVTPVGAAVFADTEFEIKMFLHFLGDTFPEMGDVLLHGGGARPDAAAHRLHRRGKNEAFGLFGALAARGERGNGAKLRSEERFGLGTGGHETRVDSFKKRFALFQGALLLGTAGRLELTENLGVGLD